MAQALSSKLAERSQSVCELCGSEPATIAFAVSPKDHDSIDNEVAICATCNTEMENPASSVHWNCLAGSIWNPTPSVQALAYRLLYKYKDEQWASEIMTSVELPEEVVNWALSAYQAEEVHKDSNGEILSNGDTVVLTQQLNIKGANFNAPKGTIVRKIRLVPDNTDQIEGKVNDQMIVILTKYVRKS